MRTRRGGSRVLLVKVKRVLSTHALTVAPVRLDSLTGLRFFAAFVVFLSHAGQLLTDPQRKWVDIIGAQGFVGVSFFYILSGFVLTWSHREGDLATAFYRRRFARIVPAYWVCLVLGVFIVGYLSGDSRGSVIEASPSILGLQAWVPVDSIYYAGNAVGWSISCEIFFYALFPLLIAATRSRGILIGLAASTAATLLVTPLALRPSIDFHGVAFWAVYVFPVQRLAEFTLGIGLAAAMRQGWRSPVPLPGAVAVSAVAYFVAGVVPFWAAVTLVTAIPFTLLIATAASADLAGRTSVFRKRRLVILGEWSYSFYLIHLLVVLCVQSAMARVHTLPDGSRPLFLVIALLVSVGASGCLYRIVEHPMERRFRHARPRLSAAEPRPLPGP